MSKSKIFFYFCLFFILGIFTSSVFSDLTFNLRLLLGGGLILSIFLISVFWKYKKIVFLGFCLLFLIFGFWRHQLAEFEIDNNKLKDFNDSEEKVLLRGRISKEPDIREDNIKITVEVESINGNFAKGKVLLTIGKYLEYKYGDFLEAEGFLKTPAEFEDFNYKDYLAKDGIYSVMYYPEIKILEKESIGLFFLAYSKILDFKDVLRRSIYQNLSPPQSSILGAMILGDKNMLQEDLKEKLNVTGVRHITAISGMHITLLIIILMQVFLGLGFWRQHAFYLTLALLVLFVVMIGCPASAVRAGIVGGIFLLSQLLGRTNFSFRILAFTASIMLVFNPQLLFFNVGFQLSFLAVIGILCFGPIFQSWLKKIPDNLLGFVKLRSILAMTLSAQVFT
ncbi:MAG: ComEC/Rec2 family competence protein, partial [Candidatus Nealsonbacteria bacterium]